MPRKRTPVTGTYRVRRGKALEAHEHMEGFSLALQNALDNIGWPRGTHHAAVQLSAEIEVRNPGTIIEYKATVI
jgi:hypothetical protein